MIILQNHKSYCYANDVVAGKINAPKYVKKQCVRFLFDADGRNKKYFIDCEKLEIIERLTKIMFMPKGFSAGMTVYEALAGFQWFFITAVLCTVYRDNKRKRRYENAVMEICRKNGKTFLVAVIFILLFFLEPRFSKFYSVAPDGSLSREIKDAIDEIVVCSPALMGKYKGKSKFDLLQNEIRCNLTHSVYKPLNYSYGRLDGKLPSVFLADEVGALPNNYAVEAMRSGQLTIINKLGCIISTKYPNYNNPFEDEVNYCKKVLDNIVEDETLFALLYEPDENKNWMWDNGILEQGNPLALEHEEIMRDLLHKRKKAVETESLRENFLCKHCNIVYQGIGTETYIPLENLTECRQSESIDWYGKEVYLGVDLSISNDNCSVAMVGYENETIMIDSWAFIPEDRIIEKNLHEKIDYREFIEKGKCIACGGMVVDYAVIENFVINLEKKMGVTVLGIGYDRYNALSSAQKWEKAGYDVIEIRQHSSVLHPPTKWLYELALEGNLAYNENRLMEINFENARCTFDTNLNRYVNKKKSNGKIDMVAAIINAVYLLQQNCILNKTMDWCIQIL